MVTVARRTKLIVQIFLLGILLTLSVTGCEVIRRIESGFKQGETTLTETPTAAPDPNEPPQTATPQTSTAPATLMLWVPPQLEPVEGNPAGLLLASRVKAFENTYPGLKVELRVKPLSGESSLLNSLAATTAAAPEALPGLVLLNRSDMETAALKSLIFPIPNRTAEYRSPDWFPFTDSLSSLQGTQFGLPLFADPLVLVYRQQMVAFPPSTWQEMVSQPNPVVFNLNDPSAAIPYTMYLSSGGNLVNEEGHPILEPEALTRTYQILFSGSSSNIFPTWLADLQSNDAAWEAFVKGQATYALVWGSQALQSPVENMAVAPVPGEAQATLVDGWLICFTNPANELSRYDMMLAEYLLNADFLARLTESTGYLPAQRSSLSQWQDQNLAGMFAAAAEQAVVIPSNEIRHQTGSLLTFYGTSLIRRQTSPMQAVLDTLDALDVK